MSDKIKFEVFVDGDMYEHEAVREVFEEYGEIVGEEEVDDW